MKYLQIILITLTVVIVVAVLTLAGVVYYVGKNNPSSLWDYLLEYISGEEQNTNFSNSLPENTNSTTVNSLDKSSITSGQIDALKEAGIDPATLPATLSQEVLDCFAEVLGEDKIKVLEQGGVLSPFDILRSAVCLKKQKTY